MQDRDTQFAGFAKLLLDELHNTGFDENGYRSGEDSQKIVARRAYDLAVYILDNVRFTYVKDIPDMTEWPVEPGE